MEPPWRSLPWIFPRPWLICDSCQHLLLAAHGHVGLNTSEVLLPLSSMAALSYPLLAKWHMWSLPPSISDSGSIKLASTPPLIRVPSRLSSCTLIRSTSLIKVRLHAPEPLAGHLAVLSNCKCGTMYWDPRSCNGIFLLMIVVFRVGGKRSVGVRTWLWRQEPSAWHLFLNAY